MGYVSPFMSTNARTASASSLVTMPSTSKSSPNCRDKNCKSGISRTQGGHQVFQKLTSTTLPRKDSRLHEWPSESARVNLASVNRRSDSWYFEMVALNLAVSTSDFAPP